MVTDVRFIGTSNRLVSCSKDTFVKVWDLDTQHLPVEGPGLPRRVGRRRFARHHLAGAPRAEARRWRDASGRDPGGSRARRPVRRAGRHHRPACRGPRQCPSPGGRAECDGWHRQCRRDRATDRGSARSRARATNFVVFKVARDRAAFLAALRARDVLMVEYPHGQVRAVTHYGVDAADIDTTIAAVRAVLADTSVRPPAQAPIGASA